MRALLPLATTLAAIRILPTLPPPATSAGNDTCPPSPPETVPSMMIGSTHILCPLLIPYAAQIVIHMPTLLLASRSRVAHIKQALATIVAIGAGVSVAAGALSRRGEPANPALAYALSLYWSLFLLSQPPHPSLVIGPAAHRAISTAGVLALAGGAWQLGPPLPVIHVPGFPTGPGAQAHLLCLLGTDLLGPVVLRVLTRILD
jgi:hypothetical protein